MMNILMVIGVLLYVVILCPDFRIQVRMCHCWLRLVGSARFCSLPCGSYRSVPSRSPRVDRIVRGGRDGGVAVVNYSRGRSAIDPCIPIYIYIYIYIYVYNAGTEHDVGFSFTRHI